MKSRIYLLLFLASTALINGCRKEKEPETGTIYVMTKYIEPACNDCYYSIDQVSFDLIKNGVVIDHQNSSSSAFFFDQRYGGYSVRARVTEERYDFGSGNTTVSYQYDETVTFFVGKSSTDVEITFQH